MAEGQYTGERARYQYTTDNDETLNIRTDKTLGDLAGTGLTAFVAGEGTPKPTGFEPRGVHWKGTQAGFEDKRKFLICGTTDATLYASDSPVALTIDGVAGVTTGRRGEKLTY